MRKIIAKFMLFFIGFNMLSQSFVAFALTPGEILNNVFHFDAQDLDGDGDIFDNPVDGTPIETLIDMANSHTGSQTDVNKQATFWSTGMNNKPALLFDGVDDLYTVEDHVDIASGEQYLSKSFAVVFQTSTDITTLQTLYEQGGQDKGYAIQIDNGSLYVGAWNTLDWPVGEQFKIADLGTIEVNSTYNVILAQNSDTGDNLAIYSNGVLVKNILTVSAQTTHGTCLISGAFSCYMFANGGSIGIGATKNDTLELSSETGLSTDEDHHFSGYIGEMMTWNTALTSAEATGLFEYLDDKWSLIAPEITIQTPAITGVTEAGDFDIYITYNDFQNGEGIDITSDDIKLYNWNGATWSADIAGTYINTAGKTITQFEAYYPVVGIPEGKFRLEFSITKENGLSNTQIRDFYVGQLLPSDIPDPVFHYDAQDVDGDGDLGNNPTNGTTVQTLVDKFNAINGTQATAANAPIIETNSINSYPSLLFDGVSDYYDVANDGLINTNSPYDQKSFAAVFKTGDDVTTFQNIYEQGGGSRGYSFVVDNGHVYAGVWNENEWDAGHQYKSVDLGVAQTNTTYFAMIVQDSQSALDNENTLKIYLNGNLASVQTHTDSQANHGGQIGIGRVDGATVSPRTNANVNTDSFFGGNIGELISWNYALDQADVNGVQEYFSQRWGIVLFSETYVIPSPTSDTTPAYTFSTNRAGTLSYNGSCASTATAATLGTNVINLSADVSGTPLVDGTYSDCSIGLLDSFGYTHILNITPFTVEATIYTLTEVTAIPTPGSDHFPAYTFTSPLEGTIEYSGGCSSNTTYANIGDNTINLNYLPDGYYENCYLRVNDGVDSSEYLLLSPFTLVSSAPTFTGSSVGEDHMFASGNFTFSVDYSDIDGVDDTSEVITLQKYNTGTLDWGVDIAGTYLSEISVTSTGAEYQSNISDYGRYRLVFEIDNIHGNTAIFERIFYIDSPELIVNTGEIDLGTLTSGSTSYSTPVEVQVRTVGAEFNVLFRKQTPLMYGTTELEDYDGSTGYGYDQSPYSGTLQVISTTEMLGNQSKNVNLNGEKNTYTYYIQLGALIDEVQAAGNYNGNVQFGIQLQYE
ncbi:LamG domain-containing protein [Candidatus Gracilibacteria bacterium]|nr:LamG domain-containing protein [Candidatus Gracilibacteria bacterium]